MPPRARPAEGHPLLPTLPLLAVACGLSLPNHRLFTRVLSMSLRFEAPRRPLLAHTLLIRSNPGLLALSTLFSQHA
jgi:hypothetical protein